MYYTLNTMVIWRLEVTGKIILREVTVGNTSERTRARLRLQLLYPQLTLS